MLNCKRLCEICYCLQDYEQSKGSMTSYVHRKISETSGLVYLDIAIWLFQNFHYVIFNCKYKGIVVKRKDTGSNGM